MMPSAHLAAVITVSLLLAGCTGASDAGPRDDADPVTYDVPIQAAHAVNGDARTVTITVTQDGEGLGSTTYTTGGKSADDFETLFTVEATAGLVKLEVSDGGNPLNFKSIDPARCTDPDFQVHVVDAAVHLWSNCD